MTTTRQVALRVPQDWLARADALKPALMTEGVNVTRTDVLRAAMSRGLKELEKKDAAQKR